MTIEIAALVGTPNAGKTSLFNALTGARQKVGNYPGVTVERKLGRWSLPDGREVMLLDLPGAYSLSPQSADEAVTRDVLLGRQAGEVPPDALVVVVDATNLAVQLRLVLELRQLGLPMVIALNMIDLAERDGTVIDVAALSAELGIPVVPTVAVRRRGLDVLAVALSAAATPADESAPDRGLVELQREARRIAARVTLREGQATRATRRLDGLLLHPVAGPLLLATVLFGMFQAVFAWAEVPMGWIEAAIGWAQGRMEQVLPDGLLLSAISDGVLAGVGSVIVFLPQILLLFTFIILLEQSGYMVRAALLMDRLMHGVGLNGRAFIPLLSSFACAIPGIMATRTIPDARDRLTTILIAPLMTCSARLPVYAVIIAAFIPPQRVLGWFNLQGLVLFGLYVAGIAAALLAAFLLRRTVTGGGGQGFRMEVPKYQWPVLRDLLLGLWQRAGAFLNRAGTVIMASTIILWMLVSFPRTEGGVETQIANSYAGRIADAILPVFTPLGFNREIVIALVPGLAAREVAVSALGTVYAIQGSEEAVTTTLTERLRSAWPLPTALAFLAWYVFAPQCLATLAVVRRETNGWRWPVFMFTYLMALAWVAAFLTNRIAIIALG